MNARDDGAELLDTTAAGVPDQVVLPTVSPAITGC